jgi:hypothetical protein
LADRTSPVIGPLGAESAGRRPVRATVFSLEILVTMPDPILTLRDIRKACELGPLRGQGLVDYWVDTDAARDPMRGVRQNLRDLLEDRDDCKILFYGHSGSGKSTELNKLVAELGQRVFVVGFSVREEMSLMDVTSEDIILVLVERLAAAALDAGLVIDQDALTDVYRWFDKVSDECLESDARTGAIEAGVQARTPSLLDVVKLFGGFKAEVRYEASNKHTRAAYIRNKPGDLLAHANRLVNAVRHGLRPDQRLLFIVEDLDKVDIATARKVFIEKPNILTGLTAGIVYTIPIFTFHSPDARILKTHFHQDVSLPMIKVAGPQGQRAEGFEVVREIVVRRLGEHALEPEALDLLIEKTGGVLQHAFEVIVGATLLRDATVPLGIEQIRYSLQRRQSEFLTEITLPYEPVPGLEHREQLYDRLRECLENQREGKPSRPSGEAIDQVLLSSCALVEYNGERWLGVHPLVQEILSQDDGR